LPPASSQTVNPAAAPMFDRSASWGELVAVSYAHAAFGDLRHPRPEAAPNQTLQGRFADVRERGRLLERTNRIERRHSIENIGRTAPVRIAPGEFD